jgi:hypothetical protein
MPFNNPKARAAFFEKLKNNGSKMSPKPKVGGPMMPPPGQPVNPTSVGAMPKPLAAPQMNNMRPKGAKFPKLKKYL